MNFFIRNINIFADSKIDLLSITLPLGISFFTFTQIAYLVDAYKGEAKEYRFVNYALFVSFFPHLLAGPIIHHKEMMPQFSEPKNKSLDYKNCSAGIYLFFIGLSKKVLIADTFAVWANSGFDSGYDLSFILSWMTSLSYTMQIYFDFSGYTDMALGSAYIFNIKLPINFNSPYRALNIREFWRRWHITLSRFMRDYVYIPMGGSKVSAISVLLNVMITFLIGGLWHGAGWTFIFWGFLHACAYIVYWQWNRLNYGLPKFLAWLITFNFVNVTWIFFRANEFKDAIRILKGMIGYNGFVLPAFLSRITYFKDCEFGVNFATIGAEQRDVLIVFLFILVSVLSVNSNKMVDNFKANILNLAFITILFMLYVIFEFYLKVRNEFIYFQF